MGTLVGVVVRGEDRDTLERTVPSVFAEIERLEAILSEWRPDSAVSRVNAAAGERPVRVPIELIEILAVAGEISRSTQGAFDATWAALADLWPIDEPDFRPPTREAIASARRLVSYRDVVLDQAAQTVFLRRRGMRLGLGGIAKAYIAERAADFAVASGAKHILIDAGGDVVARGRQGGRPWTIGVRDPSSPSRLLATVDIEDEVVTTSGDYEHFVFVDGRRYHHLLDPRTGAPASASRSATVIAPRGALAEALSTALFVLGPAGLGLVSAFPKAAAVVVDSDGTPHTTAEGELRFRTAGN
jgi:thiamine biosynthesis lipoprotein